MPGSRWAPHEITSLIQQLRLEKKALPQIRIPGKSEAAINNKRRRLKQQGLLEGIFEGRTLRPWTICELKKLTELTVEYGFSAAFIAQLQLIPDRSEYAIGKMMGRHGLGNPAAKARAQEAKRLTPAVREQLKQFLMGDGRYLPSRYIAENWGLAQKTINSYRRQLGIELSWEQARSSEEYRRIQQQRAIEFVKQTRERWRLWRQQHEKHFRLLKYHYEQHASRPAERTCVACGEQWFATKEFYYVQTRTVGQRTKTTMSRTCRLCRSAQRGFKKQLHAMAA